jgi:hypothetical protein
MRTLGTRRMKITIDAIICMMLLIITGCWQPKHDVQTITAKELNEIKCEWQEPKVSQWFYAGSEDGYHMFVHRDLPKDKYYNVRMTEYKIDDPTILSADESQWILMPWGPGYESCKK